MSIAEDSAVSVGSSAHEEPVAAARADATSPIAENAAAPLTEYSDHSGAETLAQSVAMLALMTILGRGVGFIRSLLFCRWLPEAELGEWDLANGFLNLAAPVAVLGLTGSFRRYLEHFRARGQARDFLRRVAWVTGLLGGGAVLALILARDSFASFIFDLDSAGPLVMQTAFALAPLLVFYFVFELFSGLRMFRKVTVLQFIQSISFAIIASVAIYAVEPSATVVMASYAVATLICAVVAISWGSKAWRSLALRGAGEPRLPQRTMWSKIAPFAMWIWVTNWLANLFEIVDRYMLVHFSRMDAVTSLAAVGNYASARVAPLLLVSVAAMLNSAVLPHLTADWESGRRHLVTARLAMTLKLVTITMLGGAAAIMTIAPWMFAYGFGGKFAGGQDVLPLTMVYMIWSAMATLATTYLWCAERARLGSLALAAGLVTNVILNLVLVPTLGLTGAVLATCASNLLVLLLVFFFAAKLGFGVDRGVLLLAVAPAILALGIFPTLALLCVLAQQGLTREWLLNSSERARICEILQAGMQRLQRLRRSRRSAPPCDCPGSG